MDAITQLMGRRNIAKISLCTLSHGLSIPLYMCVYACMTSDSQPVGVHRGAKNRERGWPGTKARRHFPDRRARAKLLIAYTATPVGIHSFK